MISQPSPSSAVRMRRHAPVHHVGGRDGVGARARVREGDACQQRQRGVVVDLAVVQDAAGAVRGVLAEADVGQDREPGRCVADRADRALHRASVVPGRRALLVLARPAARRAACRPRRATGPRRPIAAATSAETCRWPGSDGIGPIDARAAHDEQRLHEIGRSHAGLAHEAPQALRAPEAAHADVGKLTKAA